MGAAAAAAVEAAAVAGPAGAGLGATRAKADDAGTADAVAGNSRQSKPLRVAVEAAEAAEADITCHLQPTSARGKPASVLGYRLKGHGVR